MHRNPDREPGWWALTAVGFSILACVFIATSALLPDPWLTITVMLFFVSLTCGVACVFKGARLWWSLFKGVKA